jgi:antitoxin component YwqK of YwqJK toxin-antitoxin module
MLFVLLFLGCSERKVDESQLNYRDGKWYAVNEDEPFTGEISDIYGRYIGHIKNGKEDGEWTYFYNFNYRMHEKIKTKLFYEKGSKHGEYIYYEESGQITTKGHFKYNKMDGEWVYWREDGSKYLTEIYKNGILISEN